MVRSFDVAEDFKGWIEPDYYTEGLHKRLKKVDPPLSARLLYASAGHPRLARIVGD